MMSPRRTAVASPAHCGEEGSQSQRHSQRQSQKTLPFIPSPKEKGFEYRLRPPFVRTGPAPWSSRSGVHTVRPSRQPGFRMRRSWSCLND